MATPQKDPKDSSQMYVSQSLKRIKQKLQGMEPGNDKFEPTREAIREATELGVEDFLTRLKKGEIQITSVSDFEKLAKISLLLQVHSGSTVTEDGEEEEEKVSESSFMALVGSPEYEAMRKKLAEQMNKRNEGGLHDL